MVYKAKGGTSADQTRYRHSDNVAFRKISDEILLVPIRTDSKVKSGIYTLNGTASILWELIDGQRTVEELAQALTTQFEVDSAIAIKDTETFIADLLSFDAIVPVGV